MLPLQVGVPGGPELLVMAMILALVGLPVLLVLLLLNRDSDVAEVANGTGSADRIEKLERRVEELETELEEEP